MRILLIDTCGTTGSVALAETGAETVLRKTEAFPGRTSAERLVPAIRQLLAGEMKLNAIVVTHGPGSFTGVRVGVSAAKGLSEALGAGIVAVSRLAVIARLGLTTAPAVLETERVYAVLDAGRGEFYLGEYLDGVCVQEGLFGRDELLSTIAAGQGRLVTCDAAVAEALADLAPKMIAEPLAADALEIAIARIKAGQLDDVELLNANYLRRTDAQIFAKPKAAG
jgi:tRNA threonylcarbamoyladenosine biosynthesis protein TsaB